MAMRVQLVVSGGSLASPSAIAVAGQQLVGRNNFVDRAPFLRCLRIEFLTGQDEVATAYGADGFLPQQMNAITGHDAEIEVGFVLKNS